MSVWPWQDSRCRVTIFRQDSSRIHSIEVETFDKALRVLMDGKEWAYHIRTADRPGLVELGTYPWIDLVGKDTSKSFYGSVSSGRSDQLGHLSLWVDESKAPQAVRWVWRQDSVECGRLAATKD